MAINEWENDDILGTWYRVNKQIRTILFPYLLVNFLNKDTSILLRVINIWTNS